ncbi:MAG TPA: hypothetical protein VH331_12035 [Allosphingosinicella sp.]|nr:hypothetical protein [Allosphingosinicella sp.]
MRSSVASAGFAALLLLSLGGKIAAQAHAAEPDDVLFVRTAVALMARARLTTSLAEGHLGTIVYGRRGRCVLMVRDTVEGATYAEGYRQAAAKIGPVTYLYRGNRYSSPPGFRPLADHYLWRGLGKLGVAVPRRPLVAMAATPGCDFHAVDLRPLQELPR